MIALLVIAALLLATLLLAERGWHNVLSPLRNDVVFEGRNRSYGAYVLRREHHRVLLLATTASMAFFATALGIPRLFKHDAPSVFKPPVVTVFEPERIYEAPTQVRKPEVAPPDRPVRQRKPEDVFVPVDSTVAPRDTTPSSIDLPTDTASPHRDGPPVDLRTGGDGTVKPDREPVLAPEVMPEFPGGQAALQKWFSNNIHFEVDWLEGRTSAQVYVEFVIDGEGKVASATLLKGVDRRLDNAVLRAIRGMPDWIPGSQGGQPVSVRFAQPVRFKVLP